MSDLKIIPAKKLQGRMTVPADKSISHRAIMLASLAQGDTRVSNLLDAEDTQMTMNAFRSMGIAIDYQQGPFSSAEVLVHGRGLRGLKQPRQRLYLGNSGTTTRLLCGILSAQLFSSCIYGDDSLNKRPMKRVTLPLRQMGADIQGQIADNDEYPPIEIKPSALKGIDYTLPIASAQVKSAILFAGLFAAGETTVRETIKSRDHTEQMFRLFNIPLKVDGLKISTTQLDALYPPPANIRVPADISSAAFFIVAAAILNDSELVIENVGINPTRRGIIDILLKMGADIRILSATEDRFEPTATLAIKQHPLSAVIVDKELIPLLVDEVPILAVAATQARGTTKICGVGELRHKETDRINSMVENLNRMGADIYCREDDLYINGPARLKPAELDSFSDHRTAMSMIVAALTAPGPSLVKGVECISISFPSFLEILDSVVKR